MSIQWQDLSQEARDVMRELGNFGPTTPKTKATVKGYMWDDESFGNVKTYFDASDLRRMARALTEIASWLESRACEPEEPTP